MTSLPHAVDVRRRAGWLPDDQKDLEAWLHGHRQRVQARGEQIALHPVIREFQELIDSDSVVRMYVHQMIEQVPSSKPYRQRHVESADELLRLMNEVLTIAPEFGSETVALPLNAQIEQLGPFARVDVRLLDKMADLAGASPSRYRRAALSAAASMARQSVRAAR